MSPNVPWGDFFSLLMRPSSREPVMHRLKTGEWGTTACGLLYSFSSAHPWLRTDHAALFCRPCKKCARELGAPKP